MASGSPFEGEFDEVHTRPSRLLTATARTQTSQVAVAPASAPAPAVHEVDLSSFDVNPRAWCLLCAARIGRGAYGGRPIRRGRSLGTVQRAGAHANYGTSGAVNGRGVGEHVLPEVLPGKPGAALSHRPARPAGRL